MPRRALTMLYNSDGLAQVSAKRRLRGKQPHCLNFIPSEEIEAHIKERQQVKYYVSDSSMCATVWQQILSFVDICDIGVGFTSMDMHAHFQDMVTKVGSNRVMPFIRGMNHWLEKDCISKCSNGRVTCVPNVWGDGDAFDVNRALWTLGKMDLAPDHVKELVGLLYHWSLYPNFSKIVLVVLGGIIGQAYMRPYHVPELLLDWGRVRNSHKQWKNDIGYLNALLQIAPQHCNILQAYAPRVVEVLLTDIRCQLQMFDTKRISLCTQLIGHLGTANDIATLHFLVNKCCKECVGNIIPGSLFGTSQVMVQQDMKKQAMVTKNVPLDVTAFLMYSVITRTNLWPSLVQLKSTMRRTTHAVS